MARRLLAVVRCHPIRDPLNELRLCPGGPPPADHDPAYDGTSCRRVELHHEPAGEFADLPDLIDWSSR